MIITKKLKGITAKTTCNGIPHIFWEGIKATKNSENEEKNKAVNSSGAILVDDFRGNLISWQNNEGISIKFSDEKDDNFITINSLDELIEERILNKIINQTLKLSI